jgi:uncharacterized protein YdbL (DUF1318 family)
MLGKARAAAAYLKLFLIILTGCSPQIRVSMPDPVQIDVNMKVELEQKITRPVGSSAEDTGTPVAQSRRNRMGEIANLKNNRIVGEDKNGYLSVRANPLPPAWESHADYVNSVVAAENADRQTLYTMEAVKRGRSITDIEAEFAARFREQAFTGEWIQMPDGQWMQK